MTRNIFLILISLFISLIIIIYNILYIIIFFFYTELLVGVGFYLKEKKPEVKVVLADPQVILKMFDLFVSYCIVWSSALSDREICAVRYYKNDFIPAHLSLHKQNTCHIMQLL